MTIHRYGKPVPKFVVPHAQSIAGSTVIQQLGLDTPQGMLRMLNILMTKLDPKSEGITVTIEDMNHALFVMNVEQRTKWLVQGQEDRIFLKMCTDEEFERMVKFYETNKPGVQ